MRLLRCFWIAGIGLMSACAPSSPSSPSSPVPDWEAPEPEPGVASTNHALVTIPTAVHWWSFDELCATSQVVDTMNVNSGPTGTKLNGASCGEGKISGGVSLDGTDDVVQVPDRSSLHFTNTFTLSAWVYPTKTTGHIAGKWYAKNSYQLALSAGRFAFSIGRSTAPLVVTVSAAATQNTWSHVTGVYNGSKLSLYVNGVLAGSANTSGSIVDSTAAFTIGNRPGTSGVGYRGRIDEVKVFNTALSAVDAGRLANGLAHRRLRALVVDPRLSDGRYLHQAQSNEGWRSPEEVYNYWLRFLNDAAGEPLLYLPEDGQVASALKFVNTIPWNNGSGGCPMVRGDAPYLQTGDAYLQGGGVPPEVGGVPLNSDPEALLDPAVMGFDLIADANAQKFHELIVITPGGWGIGGEGVMVANTNDNTAFRGHDAVMRHPALRTDRKFFVHGVAFTRDDNNIEQFWHRAEAMLASVFADWAPPSVAEDPCGGQGSWTAFPGIRHAFDLWTTLDKTWQGEGHIGNAHAMPNTDVGYERNHNDAVPSGYPAWATFPANFPLDLTLKARRSRVSCTDWACSGPDVYPISMIWQLSRLPKGDGKWDNRWANWWKYVSNPNVQDGRGMAVTSPVKGPFQGAMDVVLKIREGGIDLAWKPEVTASGTYAIRRSINRVNWTTVASALPGTTSAFVLPLPAAGVATFYQVLWTNGATTRYSDMLGAKLGTKSGVLPPIEPQVALHQLNVPYVRWTLPTQCGATVPCTAEHGLACDAVGICRQGLGNDEPASDYHLGVTAYTLKKSVSGGLSVVATVNRKPGWEGQYNHIHFSAAEMTVATGTVVEYQVEARNEAGDLLGTTDSVLAVVGQSTVGL